MKSVYEDWKRPFFRQYILVFLRCTTRRYTIVILSQVNRHVSPYAVVYDRAYSTWVHAYMPRATMDIETWCSFY